MIRLENVNKRYPGGYDALNQIHFTLERGEMAFLSGPSGAGKSTLLKILALQERVTSGTVHVNGMALESLPGIREPEFRQSIGFAFQSPRFVSDRTVFDNVALPLQLRGLQAPTLNKRVNAALEVVGLAGRGHSLPKQLSAGEQQRLGIARAIVHKPALLLADEPTGNLDPGLSVEIMQLFEQLNQAGVSILVATHDLGLVAAMKYRIVCLKGGWIC